MVYSFVDNNHKEILIDFARFEHVFTLVVPSLFCIFAAKLR
jgi:hypothetical protein